MIKSELNSSEFDPYYGRYINKLAESVNLIEGFQSGKATVAKFFKFIPKNKLEYRYQIDKWSIKEVLQHIIDTERVFIYRCFRIARRDTTPLAGFDQNTYVIPSNANKKTIDELINEFEINRDNSICLLKSLSNEDLCFVGTASKTVMSSRAAAFSVIGHEIWHMDIINDRYL